MEKHLSENPPEGTLVESIRRGTKKSIDVIFAGITIGGEAAASIVRGGALVTLKTAQRLLGDQDTHS